MISDKVVFSKSKKINEENKLWISSLVFVVKRFKDGSVFCYFIPKIVDNFFYLFIYFVLFYFL